MAQTTRNLGLIFKQVPKGWPKAGQDLAVEDRPIDLSQSLPENSLLIKTYYASFDPYQRGRMRDASVKSYSPPFTLGQPITNRSIFKVLKSSSDKFAEGDILFSKIPTPTEEYSILGPDAVAGCQKLSNAYKLDPKHFIGALGMPGLTAFSSFYDIGQPKRGETIFISAASGAVGQIVGQLAKHEGLTVIGSVGSNDKLQFIRDIGFDEGFNYKEEEPAKALARLAPKGIDIYYENVGGAHLDAALDALNQWGRIVACGMISQYNLTPEERFPIRNLGQVVGKRLSMRGFIVGDENMGPKYAKEHQEKMQKWLADESFKATVSETKGIENAVEGFIGMLEGKNFGKSILVIDELEKE